MKHHYHLWLLSVLLIALLFTACQQSGSDTPPPSESQAPTTTEQMTTVPEQTTSAEPSEEESTEATEPGVPTATDVSVAQDKSLLAYLIPNQDGETYTLEIKGSGDMASLESRINSRNVTTVILPDGLTSIEQNAFINFADLKEITIPDSVTRIGKAAFMGCTSLTSITFSQNLTEFSPQLLSNCKALTQITIPESVTRIGSFAFSGCYALESVTMPSALLVIEEYAFEACYALVSISLPQNLTEIGSGAFVSCTALLEIEVPGSVQTMGADVFNGCTALQKAALPFIGASREASGRQGCLQYVFNSNATASRPGYFPETIVLTEGTHISDGAFSDSTVKYVILPDSVISMGASVFANCQHLVSIDLPDGIEVLPTQTFAGCYRLKEVELPANLQFIEDAAFSHCKSLMTLTLPQNVSNISYSAFDGCDKLVEILNNSMVLTAEEIYAAHLLDVSPEKVLIHTGTNSCWETFDGLVYFNDVLMDYCGTSTEITVGATYVGNGAFAYNTTLKHVTLTDGVQMLGERVFYDCSALESITIQCPITELSDDFFASCESLSEITLPDTITSIGEYAFQGTAYAANEENWENGVLYCGNYMLAVRGGLTELIVKDGTTLIADKALSALPFENASSTIVSIHLPESLRHIGAFSLNGTDITELVIPNGVESIGNSAFYESKLLKTVSLPSNPAFGPLFEIIRLCDVNTVILTQGTEIYENMFSSFMFSPNSTLTIHAPESIVAIAPYAFHGCSGATGIVLPDSIQSIGDFAFWNCDELATIDLPDSLQKIGDSAFFGCTGLTEIIIPDSVTEIDSCAFQSCANLASIQFTGTLQRIGKNILSATAYAQNPENWTDHILYYGTYALSSDNESDHYVIKDGTTFLSDDLFDTDDCRYYTLPSSIQYIGMSAFSNRTSKITYQGTQEQWDAIAKADPWISTYADYRLEFVS